MIIRAGKVDHMKPINKIVLRQLSDDFYIPEGREFEMFIED
jgi:hypothetical protein